MYNKYIAVRQDDLALCEAKVQAAVRETAKRGCIYYFIILLICISCT